MDSDAGEGDLASLMVKRHLEKNRIILFLCNENKSAKIQSELNSTTRLKRNQKTTPHFARHQPPAFCEFRTALRA